MTMGEKLLNMRKARGWSQEELAERVGVSRQAVSRWESNFAKPDADKIIAICDLFAISADYLLRDELEKGEYPFKNGTSEEKRMIDQNRKPVMESGRIMLRVSILIFLALLGLSRMFPSTVTLLGGETYRGIAAFLLYYDLEWLAVVQVLLFVTGSIMAYGPAVWSRYRHSILDEDRNEKRET